MELMFCHVLAERAAPAHAIVRGGRGGLKHERKAFSVCPVQFPGGLICEIPDTLLAGGV